MGRFKIGDLDIVDEIVDLRHQIIRAGLILEYIVNNPKNKIEAISNEVLDKLNDDPEATGFDPNHKTKPIIFKNGKFLGGCSELEAKYP